MRRYHNIGHMPYDAFVTPDGRMYVAGLFGEDGMAMLDLWHADAGVKRIDAGFSQSGAVPGILEECVIAVEQRTPLFLIGALGGVAVPLIEAVTQGTTSVFTRQAQRAHEPMGASYNFV